MKLLKFEQMGCRPCQMLDNYIKYELNTHVDRRVDVTDLGDAEMALVEKYGVSSLPTLVLVDDAGELIESASGFDTEKVNAIFSKRGLI